MRNSKKGARNKNPPEAPASPLKQNAQTSPKAPFTDVKKSMAGPNDTHPLFPTDAKNKERKAQTLFSNKNNVAPKLKRLELKTHAKTIRDILFSPFFVPF